MNNNLENKIKRCAKLLAESMLSDEIKGIIIEIIGDLDENGLDQLIRSLEREQSELEKLANDLKQIDKSRDLKWQKLEKKQHEKAQKMINVYMKDLKKRK